LVRGGCSAYDNEAHRGDNSSNDSDDERYERSVLEKKLATSAPPTAVVGSQHSLMTSTSPGGSLRSNASSTGSGRHSTGRMPAGKRQFMIYFGLLMSNCAKITDYLVNESACFSSLWRCQLGKLPSSASFWVYYNIPTYLLTYLVRNINNTMQIRIDFRPN